MIGPTPLLDFFKRGEVARDVRMLAAQGALTPRAYEQLAILVQLLEDPDPDVRRVAGDTLDRIPLPALQGFLARSDIPVGMREFFGDRGVFPGEIPPIEVDDPLIDPLGDAGAPESPDAEAGDESPESTTQRLAMMTFVDRLKAAFSGSREVRSILVRSPNKMIAAAVMSSPRLTDSEVESYTRMTSVSEEVLRTIGSNRAWTKNYGVVVGLTRNPRTPLALSLNLMARLSDRDVAMLAVDRNVPESLRIAARKRTSLGSR